MADMDPVPRLPDYDHGPCPALEPCLTPETCPEPLRCLIDRAASAVGSPRFIMVDTFHYYFYPVKETK
jgi:hypothetical protein